MTSQRAVCSRSLGTSVILRCHRWTPKTREERSRKSRAGSTKISGSWGRSGWPVKTLIVLIVVGIVVSTLAVGVAQIVKAFRNERPNRAITIASNALLQNSPMQVGDHNAQIFILGSDSKIHTLSILIEIEFSTIWKDGRRPDPSRWFRSAGSNPEGNITFVFKDGRRIPANLGNSNNLAIALLGSGYVRLTYQMDILPGSAIFDELAGNVVAIEQFRFPIFGTQSTYSNSDRALVRSIGMRFFVNGTENFWAKVQGLSEEVAIPASGSAVVLTKISIPVYSTHSSN